MAADDPLSFIPEGEPLDREAVAAAVEQAAEQRPPAAKPLGIEPPESPPVESPVAAKPVAAAPDGVVFESLDDEAPPAGVTFATAEPDAGASPPPVAPAAGRMTRVRGSRRRRRRGSPILAGTILLALLAGIGGAGFLMYQQLSVGPGETLIAETLSEDGVPPASFAPPPAADPQTVAAVAAGVPFESPLLRVTLSGARSPVGPDSGIRRPPRDDGGGMVDRGMTDPEPDADPKMTDDGEAMN
ncbi:MAG: hypothetical protein AAF907_03360, partial [Planctomycetota bacterium]